MKKAISVLLALVMCLGMCACGDGDKFDSKSETMDPVMEKYVGNYKFDSYCENIFTHDKYQFSETMTLNADGTGTYCRIVTEASKYILAGVVVEDGTITWEVSDDYLIINYNGKDYTGSEDGFMVITEPSDYIQTYSFELKGHLLTNLTAGHRSYKKA